MSKDIYDRGPIGGFTKDHLLRCTQDWTGERFPDGRPKVADDIIERMRGVTLTHAWGSCGDFKHQFESGFINTQPGNVLCGRALTATFMPGDQTYGVFWTSRAKPEAMREITSIGRSMPWYRVTCNV